MQNTYLTTKSCDLFLFAGEASADLHGANLIDALLNKEPTLSISSVAGPKMRGKQISYIMKTEEFEVMGFTDVFLSLPKLIKQFVHIRDQILKLNPKVCIFIDYPGFNLRLEKSLRKHGYKGKLVHYICPSVWAWAKKRINIMAQNLDLLLTIFPFEKECFSGTKLPVKYIGNPLINSIEQHTYTPDWKEKKRIPLDKDILAIFPGSRRKEIEKNLPIQLKAAKKLLENKKDLILCLSVSQKNFEPFMCYLKNENFEEGKDIIFVESQESYDLMKHAKAAIATSGTVTLELALHNVPTVVTYAIKPLDRFIAQRLLKIDLPHYCIVNIIENKTIFPELFGPYLTFEKLLFHTDQLLEDQEQRNLCIDKCKTLATNLDNKDPSCQAAKEILELMNIKVHG